MVFGEINTVNKFFRYKKYKFNLCVHLENAN